MASIPQIRGALLEEALIWLLRQSGYKPVRSAGDDPTLRAMGGGLGVVGRGECHQVDAIADYDFSPPFSYPVRLLMEAKCWNRKIPIHVVRGAVGTLKDVSEFWVPTRGDAPEKGRYHYQYAIAANSPFSVPAQRYAYAQDVFLLPMHASAFLRGLLDAIEAFPEALSEEDVDILELADIRRSFRSAIDPNGGLDARSWWEGVNSVAAACRSLRFVLVAGIASRLPVILAPSEDTRLESLETEEPCQLVPPSQGERGWRLLPANRRGFAFSFDLPEHLAAFYVLSESPSRAEPAVAPQTLDARLKSKDLRTLRATFRDQRGLRAVTFEAKEAWLHLVLDQAGMAPE